MAPEYPFTFTLEMKAVGELPAELINTFAHCCAEAQMLEHDLKTAITKDVKAFAGTDDQISFLDILEKTTLGQAKMIAESTSKLPQHKEIMKCIGFFDLVKMQWKATNRTEGELTDLLKDAVKFRNRIAHQLLAEVLNNEISVREATDILSKSQKMFRELRQLIILADGLSSKFGSVATDGSSQARFKTTKMA